MPKKRETPSEEERLRYLTRAMQQLGKAVEWVGHAALDGKIGTPSMWLSRYIANAREAIAEAEVSLQLAAEAKATRESDMKKRETALAKLLRFTEASMEKWWKEGGRVSSALWLEHCEARTKAYAHTAARIRRLIAAERKAGRG